MSVSAVIIESIVGTFFAQVYSEGGPLSQSSRWSAHIITQVRLTARGYAHTGDYFVGEGKDVDVEFDAIVRLVASPYRIPCRRG